jgi:hypothetical protein
VLFACGADARSQGQAPVHTSTAFAQWPMPNSAGLGLPNEQSYQVLGAGDEQTVLDRVTELEWQRTLDEGAYSWSAAISFCEQLSYATFDDWRLPTRIELVSLLDLSRTNPALELQAFPSGSSQWFWTASNDAADAAKAWYVYFYFGYPDVDDRSVENRVRCVRGGAATPDAAHYELAPDWSRDTRTGLTWERVVSEQTFDVAGAASYCAALQLAEKVGFRLPTMKELETLVDERRAQPAIDPEAFPNTPTESFWSSSAWSGTTDLNWYVRFDSGSALYELSKERFRVRCVR